MPNRLDLLRTTVAFFLSILPIDATSADEPAPGPAPPFQVTYKRAGDIGIIRPGGKVRIEGLGQSQHGTYRTLPHFAFVKDGEETYLVSDGLLRARLIYIDGSATSGAQIGATYALQIERSSTPVPQDAVPTLTTNDPVCGGRPCFTVAGTGKWAELPAGDNQFTAYLAATPRAETPEDTKNKIAWGSAFVPRQGAPLYYMNGCWDVRKLGYLDYQESGCDKPLLALPKPSSRSYEAVMAGLDLPWGWLYDSVAYTDIEDTTTVISTSQDVMRSMQRTTGWNVHGSVDASYGVVSASASFSFDSSDGTMQKFQDMHSQKTQFTQSQYHHSAFALVVNKINGDLHPDFRVAIASMVDQLREDALTDQIVADFLDVWGTHYAYAVTYGTQGTGTTTFTQKEISSLAEKGTNYSKAWKAEATVKVLGAGGTLGGGTTDEGAQSARSQFDQVMSENATSYTCSGGASCNGGEASGDPQVPIFLDLRPISELMAPPYYHDAAVVLGLRDRVQAVVTDKAFTELPQGGPDLGFRTLSFGPLLCNDKPCSEFDQYFVVDSISIGGASTFLPRAGTTPMPDGSGLLLDYSQGTPQAILLPGDAGAQIGGALKLTLAGGTSTQTNTTQSAETNTNQLAETFVSVVLPKSDAATANLTTGPVIVTVLDELLYLGGKLIGAFTSQPPPDAFNASTVTFSVEVTTGPADFGNLIGAR